MTVSIQNLVLDQAESLELQALDACMTDFQTLSKRQGGGNRVSFVTDVDLDHGSVLTGSPRMQKMAFIVWLERSQAAQLLDSKTPAGVNKDHEAPLRSLHLAIREVQKVGALGALDWGVDLLPALDSLDELFGEPL